MATLMYAEDNDEGLPAAAMETSVGIVTLPQVLGPYVRNQAIWLCPSDRTGSVEVSSIASTPNISYSCNTVLMRYVLPSFGIVAPPLGLGEILHPAECALLWDAYSVGTAFPTNFALYVAYRHNEMANAVFADGHAKAVEDKGPDLSGNP